MYESGKLHNVAKEIQRFKKLEISNAKSLGHGKVPTIGNLLYFSKNESNNHGHDLIQQTFELSLEMLGV